MKLKKSHEKLAAGGQLVVVAFGDSLTYGWMVRKGYLDYLSEMLTDKYPRGRFTIRNRGIPGDTAEGGLQRLRHDVIDENPDLVFVQFALNDAFSGVPPARFERAIQEIVERIKADTDAEILLVTSVPVVIERMDAVADDMYGRLRAVADREGIALAAVHLHWMKRIEEGVDFGSLVQFDQVHPTSEGYRFMAEAIMDAFE